MLRVFLVAILCMLMTPVVQSAAADEFDDCKAACIKAYPDCIDQITESNYNEVQEAKAKCAEDKVACVKKCHDDVPGAYQPGAKEAAPQEQPDKGQQEQPDKGQQEQPDKGQQERPDKGQQDLPAGETINGNIKVYEFK